MPRASVKGFRVNGCFYFDGRSGSCDCILDWFHLCGGQESIGFRDLNNGVLVRQIKEVVSCSELEGLSPRLNLVVHYIKVIVNIRMSLFSKEYLIPLVKWKVINSSVRSVILFLYWEPQVIRS